MDQALRTFLSVDYRSKKLPTAVFTGNISHYEALRLFNNFIACCNGDGLSLGNVRSLALHGFCNRYDQDFQRALFVFFREYVPHWQCVREFSYQNMKIFIAKLSNSHFFLQKTYNPAITAPRFKIVTVHHDPDRTAAVQKKRTPCSFHKHRDSCLQNTLDIPLCHSCLTSIRIAIKKGLVTKNSAREDIMQYLENRRRKTMLRIEKGRKTSPKRK